MDFLTSLQAHFVTWALLLLAGCGAASGQPDNGRCTTSGACDEPGLCPDGFCGPDLVAADGFEMSEAAEPSCLDDDHDGHFASPTGNLCSPFDCDDTAPGCHEDCSDVDGDAVADCADLCVDQDSDGYCRDWDDCDDTTPTCGQGETGCSDDRDGDGRRDCDDPCVDRDGDGYGWSQLTGQGTCLGPDCDDTEPLCGPDCAADVDADALPDCLDPCLDADRDGYGQGDGCLAADCDDEQRFAHAGAPEICDGSDNDCDGQIDAADPDLATDDIRMCEWQQGVCAGATKPTTLCANGSWQACPTDRYRQYAPAFADGVETICDGLDNNCDGSVDEPFWLRDWDGRALGVGQRCGIGICEGGFVRCTDDGQQAVCSTADWTGRELCNDIDDDCDGQTDANDPRDLLAWDPQPCERVSGVCVGAQKPARLCAAGQWQACDVDAYQDHDAHFSPIETDCADGLDNDCDGAADCLSPTCAALSGPLGQICEPAGEQRCADGLDNDADALVDCADPACAGLVCDDGVACTQPDVCQAGVCVGTADSALCDDAEDCTVDTCQPDIGGCTAAAMPDGTLCGAPYCSDLLWKSHACRAGVCSMTTGLADCDDGNDCTTDDCRAAQGCSHVVKADGVECGQRFCSPSNLWAIHMCHAGQCTANAMIEGCWDFILCAYPTCDPLLGCGQAETCCGNGTDDEGDGYADCLDTDCLDRCCAQGMRCNKFFSCRTTPSDEENPSEDNCHNYLDDDCDGLTDCEEPACDDDPPCQKDEPTAEVRDHQASRLAYRAL